MAFKFSLVAACLQQALAGGSTCGEGMITILEEGGGSSCAPEPTYNRSLLVPRDVKANVGSTIDVAGTLHRYCDSSHIKAVLVDGCKKKKVGQLRLFNIPPHVHQEPLNIQASTPTTTKQELCITIQT